MFCSQCGNQNDQDLAFCRKCGADLEKTSLASVNRNLPSNETVSRSLMQSQLKDPDELTSNGVGALIVGDGFLMVAVFLSVTNSAVSSLLWLFLLIPAFYLYGRGVANILHARQIRAQEKRNALNDDSSRDALPRSSLVNAIRRSISSGKLTTVPSVTERTTRELK